MKFSIRNITATALVAALLSTSAMAASAGFADFGKMKPTAGEQFVEVDVNGTLLKLAAAFTKNEDPEIAALIGKLERVRVNVLGLNESNRGATTERVSALRADLDSKGWKRIVTVQDSGDDVAIFVKESDADSIHGIVVTVLSHDGEAVFVNVVGDVAVSQLAKLGERLSIDPLRKLHLDEAKEI